MLKFLFNLFSRKPELLPIKDFTSKANIFSLHFSDGWEIDNKSSGGIYDFYNLTLKGVLQISGYQNRNINYAYDINKEFEKTKKKYKPEIITLNHVDAIMYNVNFGNQQQYCWIIGTNNKTAFVTYTTNETDSAKLDIEFQEVINQLNNFEIIK